ncbi:MAG: hypothetical protein ABR518_03860, partial [Actinomycetota bacterium]
RTRRMVAASSALLLAALAAVLAVPAGLAPVLAFLAGKEGPDLFVVPWTSIALVLVVAPLFAGVVGIVGSRAPKAAALLRPTA